jgi:hypothetical protein
VLAPVQDCARGDIVAALFKTFYDICWDSVDGFYGIVDLYFIHGLPHSSGLLIGFRFWNPFTASALSLSSITGITESAFKAWVEVGE